MTSAVLDAPDTAPASAEERTRARSRWLPAAWVSLAALPYVVSAIRAAGRDITFGADFALSMMLTSDAFDGDLLLGAYSRMQWSHPGPAWYYAMAPGYELLGSDGAAFVSSFLFVQAAMAALVVLAAGRARPWAQPLAAAVILGYGLAMPETLLVTPWNPFALLLPTALFLVCVARAVAGSLPAVAASAAVGTFLVQTHVGTAPLVVGLTGLALLAWAFTRTTVTTSAWWQTGAATAVTVLAWLPPVWQQLRAPDGQGNLAQLVHYFTSGDEAATAGYSWWDGAVIIGRVQAVPLLGWTGGDQLIPVDEVPATAPLLCALVIGATALLGWAGWRKRRPWTLALAVTAFAAELIAVFSATSISGDAYDYLVLWATTVPFVVILGWLELVLGRHRLRGLALGGVAVALGLMSVSLTTSHVAAVDGRAYQPGVAQALDLVRDRLDTGDTSILLDIATPQAWPVATGIAAELEGDGHAVRVDETWGFMFGASHVATGAERLRLTVLDVSSGPREDLGTLEPVGTVQGESGETLAIYLAPL